MPDQGFKLNIGIVATFAVGLALIGVVIGVVRMTYSAPPPEPKISGTIYPDEPPKGPLPEGVRPLHYVLDLRLIPSADYFSGTATLEIEMDRRRKFIWLHGRDLSVSRVVVRKSNGKEVEASYEQVTPGGVAKLEFAKAVKPGTLMIQFEYDTAYSKTLDGLYKVKSGGHDYVFSQLQSIEARRVFPSFDEPRFKATFDISVVAPEADQVITNTPEVDVMPIDDGETLHLFATSEPLPPALINFSVGQFEIVGGGELPPTDLRARPVPVRGITLPGKGGQIKEMLDATRPFVEYLERYFGQPYPYAKLDLIAVPDFEWAGMENAGAINYGENYILISPQTNAAAYQDIVDTHAHELAHQWFGNLVTPQWWDDVWLNESFASWMSGKTVDAWNPKIGAGEQIKRWSLWVMRIDANPNVGTVQRKIVDNDGIAGAFSSLAYSKGGGVIQMVESYVGPENFRAGIAQYIKRHKNGTATLDDFIKAVTIGARHPEMDKTFHTFLQQPGVPIVEASLDCSSTVKHLTLLQSRYYPIGTPAQEESFWQIPVCYRTGKGQSCHLLKTKSETLPLGNTCPAFVMPNDGANGYYLWSLDEQSLTRLLAHLKDLTPMESEAMAANLRFWYDSDRITTEELFEIAERLIALKRTRTDLALIPIFTSVLSYAPDRSTREKMKARINTLYADRAADLGINPRKGEPAGRSLLREALVPFLVTVTEDANEVARLQASLKRSGIDLNKGLAQIKKIEGHEQSEAVLSYGVVSGNLAFTNAMIEALKAGKAGDFDGKFLTALAMAKSRKTGERLLKEVLTDKDIPREVMPNLVNGLAVNPDQALRLWTHFGDRKNFKNYLEQRSESSRNWVVGQGQSICDDKTRAAYDKAIKGALDLIPGGEGEYAWTDQAIAQCLAIKAAKGPELKAYFK